MYRESRHDTYAWLASKSKETVVGREKARLKIKNTQPYKWYMWITTIIGTYWPDKII